MAGPRFVEKAHGAAVACKHKTTPDQQHRSDRESETEKERAKQQQLWTKKTPLSLITPTLKTGM